MHNPDLGVIRLNKEEMSMVGGVLAEKLNRALGPTAVIIPTRSLSGYGEGWEDFYDKEADRALFEVLKKRLKTEIKIVEVDCQINDKIFSERATSLLDDLMHNTV